MSIENPILNKEELPIADEATEKRFLELLESFMYGAGKGLSEEEVDAIKKELGAIRKNFRFSEEFENERKQRLAGMINE